MTMDTALIFKIILLTSLAVILILAGKADK